MSTTADYLRAYDEQLRGESETPGQLRAERLGPLRLVTFPGGRGFVTYRDLDGADEATIRGWVPQILAHYRTDPRIERVEWKLRGHDHAPGLIDALLEHGFVPDEPESIMIGEARLLAVDVPVPEGVVVRQVDGEGEVRAACAMQDEAFGEQPSEEMADAVWRRLQRGDGMQLWVAEAGGQFVSAGRLEPVPDTDFAGLWGGATLEAWRGRGIYRALTAARARSAIAAGKTLMNSDSSEYSRPILERSGFVKVPTTTPYRLVLSGTLD